MRTSYLFNNYIVSEIFIIALIHMCSKVTLISMNIISMWGLFLMVE